MKIICCLLFCLGALAASLTIGAYPLTLSQIITLLFSSASNLPDPQPGIVFWQIRLPRILAALLIGAGLSGAGAAYQGMFRNPLVSPDILGVSAGAGLGACLAIWLDLPMFFVQMMAFSGGLLVVALVNLTARFARSHDPVLSLVLTGIAWGTLSGAAISLIKTLADPYTQLPGITFWLLGGLSGITPEDLISASVGIVLGLLPLLLLRWRLNLLSLPDEEAQIMGVNVRQLRAVCILSATLITASAVAVAGIIGWVGLVIPHISRLLAGADHRRLLPASLFYGGLFLLCTDTLARSINKTEVPLGILTAFIGAPFFIALLLQGARR
ncbi:FecCD family ABC transporter permease [Kalamiella sp. sgz302252]|uniref:FecCD family ABC transporter permease n=1 Tax=Pantoea sp. sgz302252 TaxID=3341827 RepID=UPI0036D3FB86